LGQIQLEKSLLAEEKKAVKKIKVIPDKKGGEGRLPPWKDSGKSSTRRQTTGRDLD